jgi:hypothetical protein
MRENLQQLGISHITLDFYQHDVVVSAGTARNGGSGKVPKMPRHYGIAQ